MEKVRYLSILFCFSLCLTGCLKNDKVKVDASIDIKKRIEKETEAKKIVKDFIKKLENITKIKCDLKSDDDLLKNYLNEVGDEK